ncbi:MAG: riboflavin kinase, partial [Bacilli bacterium]|nr:riboflavin kinase [Bacilli bacterium]
ANIKPKDNYVFPKKGVYATYVKIEGKTYLSMTNIGNHPTIDRLDYESIEANIFDFEENIYQKEVEVYFLEFMRDEKKFDSVNDLIVQLNHDRDYVVAKYKKTC